MGDRTRKVTDRKGQMPMEKHIQLVGILNIVYRSLSLLGSIVLFILAGLFGEFFDALVRWGSIRPHEIPVDLLEIIPIILTVIGILVFIVSTIGIIAAVGVLRRKEWGRILLLVVSFFNLLRIPLGTILGIYTIWVLLNNDTIKLFNNPVVPPAPAAA
jgi:hypothetical protein